MAVQRVVDRRDRRQRTVGVDDPANRLRLEQPIALRRVEHPESVRRNGLSGLHACHCPVTRRTAPGSEVLRGSRIQPESELGNGGARVCRLGDCAYDDHTGGAGGENAVDVAEVDAADREPRPIRAATTASTSPSIRPRDSG